MNLSKVDVVESYHTIQVGVELSGYVTANISMLGVVANGKLRKGSVRVKSTDEKVFYKLDEKLQHKILLAVTERFSASLKKEEKPPVFKPDGLGDVFEKLEKCLTRKSL
jgi:hypothetical protein